MQKNWFERNPKKTLGGTILFGFGFVLLIAELGCRLFVPAWIPGNAERVNFWVYDPILGWSHKPGQKGRFIHRDFSIDIQINSDGLRDKDYSFERTDKKRMLILGDSFSWGFGVEYPEIFSEILEQKHPDWEIINTSVSGYGTDQQLLYLKTRGIQYRPDIVLLLFSENDFFTNLLHEVTWYYKPVFRIEHDKLVLDNYPVPKSTYKQKLDRFFYGRTYLFVRIYREVNDMIRRLQSLKKFLLSGKDAEKKKKNNNSIHGEWKKGAVITNRLIIAINKLSQENHAKFILVSTPMKHEQITLLEELSEKEAIPYLPLDQSFSNSPKSTTFAHDGHWNPKGHKIVAIAIEKFLQDLTIF